MNLWEAVITLRVVIASEEKPCLIDPPVSQALERDLSDRVYQDTSIWSIDSIGEIPEGWCDLIPYGIDKDAKEHVGDRNCAEILAEVEA